MNEAELAGSAEPGVLKQAAWDEWWLYGSKKTVQKRSRKRKCPDFDSHAREQIKRPTARTAPEREPMVVEWTSPDGVACVSTSAASI
jgi:hypothetical protein